MSDLSKGIDSYFWLSALTIFIGGLGVIVRYSYKSKCSSVDLCCIKIVRNIETELKEDIEEMRHPMPSSPSLQKTSV
jgi:hypothetical protein